MFSRHEALCLTPPAAGDGPYTSDSITTSYPESVPIMPDFTYEQRLGRDSGRSVCGVDEVGRGPLAGCVVAAAAVIPLDFPEHILNKIKDSKKLTARQREELYPDLIARCPHAVAEASVEEIDRLNILQASLVAMRRAVEQVQAEQGIVLTHALVDGNKLPQLPCAATAVVGGDDKVLSIAVASIIAKVTRDRMMQDLAQHHPEYGWERNAGYGTKEHLVAIDRYGITPWHRLSFAPIASRLAKSA